ncbi:26S proteasome regulatory subunit RPN6, putative [Plasmodium berghei]|uniref:26S proteasome regulatory subunit RPN6, putative n=2 Tax=Plasmodium berghei TaxID=5821 RepID=A0A509ANI5_PLABA|nr:26S proteasome regulatory subunit RPN6, putative [Plasmodium berghei ANKA]CXI57110.1 26S proteasome regulatory subunit RPN6, putative [Plasmodium berghei]SCL95492.1 26S proteasome regulatory subunit RPN6, putative [Plasmodium berghei]SCM16271.1 26S proteasome regulatory subunit RPN6, putative [Plasmodium berghei]SCM18067.1 26S proteasome regulatory subunit RPN6, putative [Plasmodium berghei]SCN26525.1 26S proteasome regulatory subunit RPN6, putative [Plasmodium berghei]|eukprot:XP_034422195.1 26S proteasome regulatory subunit RPN6, putative [Plasmodium berghei ANKA]
MEAFEEIESAYKEIEDEIIRSVDSLCDGNYLKIKDEVIMPHMSDSLIEKIIILNRHINDNSNPKEFEKKVTNEKVMQINDKLIYLLCDYYINKKDIENLINFTTSNENYFSVLPQAKTAKLIRNIVEKISKKIRNISTLYIIFKKYMNWAYEKKRNFLRCRIEVKIIILFILKQKYKTALSLIERLLKEVKKVDDKALLLELYIVETKIYMLLKNSTKMKASLTFAKNIANTINTAIYINSEIDLLSGILYIYEKDYRSAYIYLYECYETLYTYIYNSQNNTLDFLSKKHNDFYSVIIHNIINTSTISSQNRTKSISQISPFLLSFYTFYEYYDSSNSLLNVDEINLLSNNVNLIYSDIICKNSSSYQELDEEKMYCITNPIELNYELIKNLTIDNYGNLLEFTSSNAGDMRENNGNKNPIFIFPENKNINGNFGLNLNIENLKLIVPLKYMLLCKILEENNRKDINTILCENNKLNYIPNKEIQILLDISKCYENRTLDIFENVIKYNIFLINIDKVIYNYLKELYELLLEKNILKIIEAYSCIDLNYIGQKLNLDINKIISKLSEMILDKKLNGTLDQNAGILILYDDMPDTKMYQNVLEIINNLTESVDILYQKAQLTI